MKLTSLDVTDNNIGAAGARVLASLVNLTHLDLARNKIGAEGAQALRGLLYLASLNLWDNNIGSVGAQALSGLVNLKSLDLGRNNIGSAGAQALSGLVSLSSLNLRHNNIGPAGAQALSGLVNLSSLDLDNTGVTNLSPLLALNELRELNCSGCQLSDAVPELWSKPSLQSVILNETVLQGVPAELLSRYYRDNCLDRLRAHFADLAAGGGALTDVKLMFLGNGRVGKTQICRRLRGEAYDEREPSTHGVRVSSARLSLSTRQESAPTPSMLATWLKWPKPSQAPESPNETATLKIWDFGGQDIYHGTHALFLKTRAAFLLAWENRRRGHPVSRA